VSGGQGAQISSPTAVAETPENMKTRLQHLEIEGEVSDAVLDTVADLNAEQISKVVRFGPILFFIGSVLSASSD
jgi:uncharacterized protein YgbK (DUF1537 family)